MPDVSDQERGRRVFQIQKEKHAEEALEKVRKNLGEGWKRFTLTEIRALKFILGETWVFVDRKAWEGFSFARLSRDDLEEILAIGKAVERKEKTEHEASDEVAAVLHRISGEPSRPS
ncbi:MAG TPA: hypothetical protein VMT31_08900 [Methanomicrobiales archaeon]|jgi:hypothetical protein|nr:hypothetical protein [Methanomicrobiales archaeon]